MLAAKIKAGDMEYGGFSGEAAYQIFSQDFKKEEVDYKKLTYGFVQKMCIRDRDKVRYVLNKKETILAREKQAQIKSEFERWLFADPERGARLTKLYNDKFNNLRPRVYDGSDLAFPDMSDDIALRTHQRDVVCLLYTSKDGIRLMKMIRDM